jgi:hypothetical protein
MGQLEQIIGIIALSMGTAWASGINLYATILVLGILGHTGDILLPPGLEILTNPVVIGAAGLMYLVEFFADKFPGVDTGWDVLHTFIRIPAGALLAAGAVGEMNPALALAAAIIGGGLAAGSHAAKAGSRVLINASPEPVSNWIASIGEDIAVIAGLWTALHYPSIFIGFLVLFLLMLVWLLPKVWKGIKALFQRIGKLFSRQKADSNPESKDGPAEVKMPGESLLRTDTLPSGDSHGSND